MTVLLTPEKRPEVAPIEIGAADERGEPKRAERRDRAERRPAERRRRAETVRGMGYRLAA